MSKVWTEERKAAHSEKMKARWAEKKGAVAINKVVEEVNINSDLREVPTAEV